MVGVMARSFPFQEASLRHYGAVRPVGHPANSHATSEPAPGRWHGDQKIQAFVLLWRRLRTARKHVSFMTNSPPSIRRSFPPRV
jgi:hypothetical protein